MSTLRRIDTNKLMAAILFANDAPVRVNTQGVLINRDGTLVATDGHAILIVPNDSVSSELGAEDWKPVRISVADAKFLAKSTPNATKDEPHAGLYLDLEASDSAPQAAFVVRLAGEKKRSILVDKIAGEYVKYHAVLPKAGEEPVFRFGVDARYLIAVGDAVIKSGGGSRCVALEFFAGVSDVSDADNRAMRFSVGSKTDAAIHGAVMPMRFSDRKSGLLAAHEVESLRATLGGVAGRIVEIADVLDKMALFPFNGGKKKDLLRRLRVLSDTSFELAAPTRAKEKKEVST